MEKLADAADSATAEPGEKSIVDGDVVAAHLPLAKPPKSGLARYLPQIGLLLILATVATVRYRFLETPLERDEGEFAYGGQLILAGERPYVSMYAMKLPGIYLAYALIEALFGQTIFAIHFGLLLVNLASIVLIYFIGRKVGEATGLIAAAIFSMWTLSPTVQGTQTQAEHFVVLFALLGLQCLLVARQRREVLYCFLSGIALGLAVSCKQHGFVFPLFGLTYVACRDPARWKSQPGMLLADLGALLAGCLVPWLICCGLLIMTGALGDFFFWTFVYPKEYVTLVRPMTQLQVAWMALVEQWEVTAPFWIAALVGLSALFWCKEVRSWRTALILLLVFCCLGIMPGGYYRHHYFLFLAAPFALLAAIGWHALAAGYRQQGGGRLLPLVLLLMIFAWPAWCLISFYSPLDAQSLSAKLYRNNPFRDAVKLSQFLQEQTSAEDRIGILGSEPEIFFYTKRRSATGHIYMYPLTEPHPFAHKLQRQVIDEIEAARPKFIVYFANPASWFSQRGADMEQFQSWMDKFLTEQYFTVGVIEPQEHADSLYRWGDEVKNLREINALSIIIHQRRM